MLLSKRQLINRLNKYSISALRKIEESDLQFQYIKEYNDKKYLPNYKKVFFIKMITLNALIQYQLSGSGEDCVKEFIEFYEKNNFKFFNDWEVKRFFKKILKTGKYNRRFTDIKIKRIEKGLGILLIDKNQIHDFYETTSNLVDYLSSLMEQEDDAKTIVFAVKMFHYAHRIFFPPFKKFDLGINIPIDSRIEKFTYENIKEAQEEGFLIKEFWKEVGEKLKYSLLHYDALLWTGKF